MEAWRIAIPIIILIVACIGAYHTIRIMMKERNERTYVYPKTGHKYMPLYRCKLKCPVNGEWFDAIIYKGVEDEKYYVRERKDFFDKFVKLKDYENGNNSK